LGLQQKDNNGRSDFAYGKGFPLRVTGEKREKDRGMVNLDVLRSETLTPQMKAATHLIHHLKVLRFWDPLRGDPRFGKIVTSLAPK
jgi:hypothetical protein